MRIAIVLPGFHMGGVERWSLQVRSALEILGHQVDILVTGSIKENSQSFKYEMEIKKISFTELFSIIILHKYQIVISALTRHNFILSILCFFTGVCHVASVHITLQKQVFESQIKFNLRSVMHKIILKMSNATIAVSEGVANELRILTNDKYKIVTIYNPCFTLNEIHEKDLKFEDNKIKIVAAGRLCYQKGFDVLIKSFKALPEKIKEITTLTIYGDGEPDYKDYLEKIISDEKRITLGGNSNNLLNVLRNYDIFILSSRYEGFGNVLAEALAADCYCISFDVAHGPSEILKNGNYGTLIDMYSINSLTENIFDVIVNSKYKNRQYSSNARREYLNTFTPNYFSIKIKNLLNEINIKI